MFYKASGCYCWWFVGGLLVVCWWFVGGLLVVYWWVL